ncbi:MAG: aspartyl protease family protein [Phormidesmis sp.]
MNSERALEKFRRAQSLIAVERVFEALPLLDELIEADPAWAQVYMQRAQIRKRLGDGERAIADYSKAIRLAPTAEKYLARALVWLSLDQVMGAIADSRQAIALRPELAGGYRLLGKALGLLGDGEGAIAAYKQAARCYLSEKDKQNAQQCINAIGPLRDLPPFVAPAVEEVKSHEVQPTKKLATSAVITQPTKEQDSEGSTVLIKSFERHLPVVEAMFDGIARFDVVIDRNAPNSIITQRIAKQLKLEEISYEYVYLADGTPMELSIAKLRSVVIGTTVVIDVRVAILPKRNSTNILDTATVVLGKDCFSGYSIRISGDKIIFMHR